MKPLWAGVLVAIVYFGVQPVAAQFYPGYDFVTQVASELGSSRSQQPWILNTGAILSGVLALIAAMAFPSVLRRWNTFAPIRWATTVAMISLGAAGIWAGSFPLPDPRHNPGLLGAGAFLLPILFAIAIWRRAGVGPLKVYLLVNAALFLMLIPVMSGWSGIDISGVRGAMQRIAAAVLYLPVSIVSGAALREARR